MRFIMIVSSVFQIESIGVGSRAASRSKHRNRVMLHSLTAAQALHPFGLQ